MFGEPAIPFERVAELIGAGDYGKRHSRVGGFPEVLGAMPASLMAKEITTPGEGRMRALFVSAGNPVLSVPNGAELAEAIAGLELSVAIDIYMSDTARLADYVLPATTFLEREDMPLPFLSLFTKPYINMTEAVVEPAGEARQEWEIIEDVSKRIGIVPQSLLAARWLGKAGLKLTPRQTVDLLLRLGPEGDRFGLRRDGLNLGKLADSPHGVVLADELKEGVLAGKIRHRGGRVQLCPAEIAGEVGAIAVEDGADAGYPLRLIGLRELRSHNSWMHNSRKLMAGDRAHRARVNPADAAAAGVADGGRVRISSAHGSIETEARVTDEVIAGTVAVPHGWGHDGGWETANAAGGANVNLLMSSRPADLERLAGMAHLNGVPVRIAPAGQPVAPL
jgi:formate dehydrogenase